ncbi:MAG: PPOX class F420-dependent oxidoreductase [Actinomycetota bacterium]|jgi:PPOX class probable F420-dependent enzyme
MAGIPDKFADIFDKKSFAHVATLMPDGTPQVTPVWIDSLDNGDILLNTAEGRAKERNLRRDPRVVLAVQDPDNPYRYVQVRGRVKEMTTAGADAHIDKLAHKYLGVDSYPNRRPGEVRVLIRIAPERVQVFG